MVRRCLAEKTYDGDLTRAELECILARTAMTDDRRRRTLLSIRELIAVTSELSGGTLQDRWQAFEWQVWPEWLRGMGRIGDSRWSFRVAMLVSVQAARPSWPFLEYT